MDFSVESVPEGHSGLCPFCQLRKLWLFSATKARLGTYSCLRTHSVKCRNVAPFSSSLKRRNKDRRNFFGFAVFLVGKCCCSDIFFLVWSVENNEICSYVNGGNLFGRVDSKGQAKLKELVE